MANYSQEKRLGELFTPLGKDALLLQEFSGVELVNGINEFHVTALTPKGKVDVKKLIGTWMRVDIVSSPSVTRVFHQICFGASLVSESEEGSVYEFLLRPWFWALGMRTNSRIFSQLTVVEIVKKICAEYDGFVDDRSDAGLPILEYVVQFCETDLQFARRLLEESGINFHCEMEEKKHSLVLTSDISSFAQAKGSPRHDPGGNFGSDNYETIATWAEQNVFTTSSVKMMDYNFTAPTKGMNVEKAGKSPNQFMNLEYYEYPGRYGEKADGNAIGQRRLDAIKTGESLIDTTGDAPCLGAGMKFTFRSEHEAVLNGEYGVLKAHHQMSNSDFRSGGQGSASYSGSYVLSHADNPVAPLLTTTRPRMMGPQTAIVCDGGDGNVDKYGRIIVKFHWDTNAQSMPCRVSQSWAGPNWGAVFIPHTGMEVIVDFIGGDPDRPIIMGCVYNGDNMPPWPLPDKKTISGVKTVTANEISFDDLVGKELINIDAKKNFTVHVTEDHTIEVDKKRVIKVHETETTTVDKTLTIESKQEIILKVGSSKITMKEGSISIEAMAIDVKASTSLKTNGGTDAKHEAGGMMTIQATLVKIN